MIARFKLVFLACFFMFTSPALAQEDEFAKIFSYYDGALKCQAATKLTANYLTIYQTLNRGLEKWTLNKHQHLKVNWTSNGRHWKKL